MRVILGCAVILACSVVGDPVAQSVTVAPDADLQQALNRARPGDTILLQRGATYTGNFVLPATAGASDERPITLRTAGDDGLPAAGERMSPGAAAPLAKLRSANGSAVLSTAAGARGWHIVLVEFLANRNGAGEIIALGDGSHAQHSAADAPSQLRLDRLYIHGDPERGQKRGIALNAGKTTITGCYVSEIKAIGQDSQAIGGWNGPGDYLIENNYLEAAGENVMFGGGDPAIDGLVPTGIVVRRNVMSKPLSWREPGAPKWQVKNIFELKNARHVVVEGNVLERSWSQAQSGYAVLFTVRNQDGACTWCQVEDVQFRGNLVRDVAAGVQVLGIDPNHPSRQTNRIVVADNVFDGIDKAAWGGDGNFLLLSDEPKDVTIDHNTIRQGASNGIIKISKHGETEGLKLTNNLVAHGEYGIIGTDHGVGNDSIAAYLPGATITHNVIAGGNGSHYPSGNFFPSVDEFKKQFVDFATGDFHLSPASRWRRAGSDGRDLGADLAKIPFALAGARAGTR